MQVTEESERARRVGELGESKKSGRVWRERFGDRERRRGGEEEGRGRGKGEREGERKGGEGCQWVLHPAIQIVKAGADALLQLQGVCFQGSHSHMQGSFKRSELIWQSHIDVCSTLSPAIQLLLNAATPSEFPKAILQATPESLHQHHRCASSRWNRTCCN